MQYRFLFVDGLDNVVREVHTGATNDLAALRLVDKAWPVAASRARVYGQDGKLIVSVSQSEWRGAPIRPSENASTQAVWPMSR